MSGKGLGKGGYEGTSIVASGNKKTTGLKNRMVGG